MTDVRRHCGRVYQELAGDARKPLNLMLVRPFTTALCILPAGIVELSQRAALASLLDGQRRQPTTALDGRRPSST